MPKTHREKNLSFIYPSTVSIDTVRHVHLEPTEKALLYFVSDRKNFSPS